MKHNILVTGGTGKTGHRVVERLTQLDHQVKIGSRSQAPFFDWNNPATYSKALNGVDRAYLVYYPDLAVPGAAEAIRNFTSEALKQGVEKVVLLSGKGEREAEKCEQIVAGSGLNYTLVPASWFNQNFSESFLTEPVLAGQVALPMPEAEIPFVDADDIADVVTKVLLDDTYNGQIITVTGPEKLTFREVVAEIAEATKRKITYQPVSLDDYALMMKEAGLPEDYIWLFSYLFREVLGNPANQEVSDDVEKVLGRRAISFREYAQRTAAAGVWSSKVEERV